MATKTYKVVIDVDSKDVEKLEKQLAGVSDEVKEIENEVSGLSMDDKFKAAGGSIKIMAGALAGAVGTLGLFGVESEVMGEFEKKAASAIAVAIGFRDVAEGLNDMRTALKGVTAAQIKANIAALANPYVAVGVAIAALTVGFAKYVSKLTDDVVPTTTVLKNMFLSLGNAANFATRMAISTAEALDKMAKAQDTLQLERSIAVLAAYGKDTIDLEIQLQEKKLKALEEGSEEYDAALTTLLVLRARKTKGLMDLEADAIKTAFEKRLEEIRLSEVFEKENAALDKEWFATFGNETATSFAEAFNKTVQEEFDPNSILVISDEDEQEILDNLMGPDGIVTKYQNGLQAAIDKTIGDRETWENFVNVASEAFANIEMMSNSRYERTLLNLEREKNAVLNNTFLTEEERIASIERIEAKERAVEIKRIKAERDMFQLKQMLIITEQVMKAKSYAMEQIQIAQLNVAKATATAQEIALAGTAAIGKASMSLGSFVAALGPFGIAAFAISIGGIIASIVSARKKAKAQIAAIGGASTGGSSGGGSVPSAPSMSSTEQPQIETQLCAEPTVRAYVISGDARNATEADAKLSQRRTLG
tara:strand:+ start:812 stop:2587 length:1776 start_codon:yes stop_codon:yes gene_type:complete